MIGATQRSATMKVTGIRTKPYWYRTTRPFADVNFPEGRRE